MSFRRDDELSAWDAYERGRRRLEDTARAQNAAEAWLRTDRPDDLEDPNHRATAWALFETRRQALLDIHARHRLEVALDALVARGAEPAPSTALMQFTVLVPWLNSLGSGAELLDQLVPDPRHRFLGTAPEFGQALADQVMASVDANRPIGALPVIGGGPQPADDYDYWDVISTGLRMAAPPLPEGQAVGVLLPLRLVTRFLGPDADGSWRVRVRIYPDEACRDRTPHPPDTGELDAVCAMWDACAGRLSKPEGETAFRRLADAVGAPRAAWLTRSVAVEPGAGGSFTARSPAPAGPEAPATFDGLAIPTHLELWARWSDGSAELLQTLTVNRVDAAQQLDLQSLAVTAGEGFELPEVWWTDWAAAELVGLATEIRLPRSPTELDVLSVVGLDDEPPGPFWLRQRDSGRLSVLAPGTPTSTVDGAPAAEPGDAKAWWRLATSSGLDQAASADASLALTGGAAFLGPLPGGDLDRRWAVERAVELLWPVLFGRSIQDVWDAGSTGDAVADWAARLLNPEGPYPTIRLGDQPYAILPATSASAWKPADGDPPAETEILRVAGALRDQLAARAEAAGTVVGAGAERLLDLHSCRPRSDRPAGRRVVPLAVLRWLAQMAGDPGGFDAVGQWWRERNLPSVSLVADPGELPLRPYVAWDWPKAPRDPSRDPELLYRSVIALQMVDMEGIDYELAVRLGIEDNDQVGIEDIADHLWARSEELVPAPLGLLARLARHSLVLTKADFGRLMAGTRPWRRANVLPVSFPGQLLADAHALGQKRLPPPAIGDPDHGGQLVDGPAVARRYRRVRAALDALLERPDLLAVADDVLGSLVDIATYRVDPWFTGLANRRFRSLLDRGAPARLGAYGWVDAPRPWDLRPGGTADPAPGPTEAGLIHAPSPEQARTAAVLRSQAVYHPADDRWDLTLASRRIRGAMRVAGAVRAGVPPIEALGRRVEEIAGDPGTVAELRRRFPMRVEHGVRRVCDGEAVLHAALSGAPEVVAVLTAGRLEEIRDLQLDLDAYADLCVTEGVHQALHGRPEAAGVAMDAAAGLGPPPVFEALQTQREGSSVVTSSVVALPMVGLGPAATSAPAALADPSFAAEAAAATGDPAGAGWTWRCEVRLDGGAPEEVAVTLAALGLEPADVAVLGVATLDGAIEKAATAGRPPGNVAAIVGGAGRRSARLVRALAALLDGPAGPPRALLDRPPATDADAALQVASGDLAKRLVALIDAAQAVRASLLAAEPGAEGRARRFGIESENADDAAAELDRRVAAAQAVLAAPARDVAALSSAIRRVLGAAGPFPVLSLVPKDALADPPPSAVAAARWREVVAAVREPVARLDAWQHATGDRWSAWCDPAEPWALPGLPEERPSEHRVLVVHGPGVEEDQPAVAVTVDTLAETIPSTRHTTGAAFGFNGPRARAPQAIVLAVPPDENRPLDTETLVGIIDDLRVSARARAVGPDDLDDVVDLLPMPMLLLPTPAGSDPMGHDG